jgi:hypothetical protein
MEHLFGCLQIDILHSGQKNLIRAKFYFKLMNLDVGYKFALVNTNINLVALKELKVS